MPPCHCEGQVIAACSDVEDVENRCCIATEGAAEARCQWRVATIDILERASFRLEVLAFGNLIASNGIVQPRLKEYYYYYSYGERDIEACFCRKLFFFLGCC